MSCKFDVFIITNGRSTFKYAYRLLKQQVGVSVRIKIVKDMGWIQANNYCVANCKSDYFLRVDDDMFLHPFALNYINQTVINREKRDPEWPNTAMMVFKLFETWKGKPVTGIKLYNKNIVKQLGGFKANHLGKIDKCFSRAVSKSKFRAKGDKSVVGIHAASDPQETIKYARMRGEHKGSDFGDKVKRLKAMNRSKYSVDQEFSKVHSILKGPNRKFHTKFWSFILRQKRK